jgi:hypothetical protein
MLREVGERSKGAASSSSKREPRIWTLGPAPRPRDRRRSAPGATSGWTPAALQAAGDDGLDHVDSAPPKLSGSSLKAIRLSQSRVNVVNRSWESLLA